MKHFTSIILFIILASCASTQDHKFISITDRNGKIGIDVESSYNQAAIPGTVVHVITESGEVRGALKILSGEIKGGSGPIEIKIRNTGNLGFEDY